MQSLGPFDPLAISAGILTNLAYDILKHYAQSLDGTLVGQMLKQAGIADPNFEQRVHDTLVKSLGLFFKEYPQYALTGIEEFFKDEVVARQIGNYILDRHPLDQAQLQAVFEHHFSSAHSASQILFQRRRLSSQGVIKDFLECYRRVIGEQLSVPEMGILLAVLDQSTSTVNEIKASEQRLKDYIDALLKTMLSPEVLRNAYRTGQQQIAKDLASEVQASTPAAHLPALFTSGLCQGRVFQSASDQYFVSHGFDANTLADWREVIVNAISEAKGTQAPLKPYFAGDTILSGFRLCGICEKLFSAEFCFFLLPAVENRNVYLELGIAIGLGKPFFLVQERDAILPPSLQGLGLYTQRGSFITMRHELAGQVKEYNFGAVRFVKDKPTTSVQPQYLVGAGEQFDDEDFEWSTTTSIETTYPQCLQAISLSSLIKSRSNGPGLLLEHLVETIQTTRFALYRVDEQSSPTIFLALGMSIGLSRPFLMIHRAGTQVPLDIQGMSSYKFPNFITLKKELVKDYHLFFDRHAH